MEQFFVAEGVISAPGVSGSLRRRRLAQVQIQPLLPQRTSIASPQQNTAIRSQLGPSTSSYFFFRRVSANAAAIGPRSCLGVFGFLRSLPAWDATRGEVPRFLVAIATSKFVVDLSKGWPVPVSLPCRGLVGSRPVVAQNHSGVKCKTSIASTHSLGNRGDSGVRRDSIPRRPGS